MAGTAQEHSLIENMNTVFGQFQDKLKGMEERLERNRKADFERLGVKADGEELPNLFALQEQVADLAVKHDKMLRARKATVPHEEDEVGPEYDQARWRVAKTGSYKGAMLMYMRKGNEGLDSKQAETLRFQREPEGAPAMTDKVKSMLSTDFGPGAGWMATPHTEQAVDRLVKEMSSLDAHATTITIGTGVYEGFIRNLNRDPIVGRGERESPVTQTERNRYNKRTITVYEDWSETMISRTAMEDVARDLEAEVGQDIQEEMAVRRGILLVNGSGDDQPKGLNSAEAGYLEVDSGVADNISPRSLRALPYDEQLKAPYRANGLYMLSRSAIREAMLFREDTGAGPNTGAFMWQPAMTDGTPSMLNGFRWSELIDLDAVGAGAYPVFFGDFRKAYRIVNRRGIRVIRNDITDNAGIIFKYSHRFGGAPWITEAAIRLRCAA